MAESRTQHCLLLSLVLVVFAAAGQGGCEEDKPVAGRDHCDLTGTPPADPQPQILFGDLHAHSTNSLDALVQTLPLALDGTADRDPFMRCDFARYCAQLDFWSLNDHPEEQLTAHWHENVEAVRTCNDRFEGYDHEPRMVTYLGWEYTHNSEDPTTDIGHRQVVLKHTCDGGIPARPISAPSGFAGVDEFTLQLFADMCIAVDPENEPLYNSVMEWVLAYKDKPVCDPGVPSPDLPADCHEIAQDPVELYEKLDQWDLDALVIPHGVTWGVYHNPPATWRHQYNPAVHDPRYDRLIEIYSGHGNGEHYRSWRPAVPGPGGTLICPDPTPEFEPCCWRAGEIVRLNSETCSASPLGQPCEDEVEAAKQAFLDAGLTGLETQPGTTAEDWLDCDQCRDCFQPALSMRPMFSVQAALAMSNFDNPSDPWQYKFGIIGSTDSHRAGPGAGYKEFRLMSDGFGASGQEFTFLVRQAAALVVRDPDRQNSYFFSGGLVAVHSLGRSRNAIWEALNARRVYATSGDRGSHPHRPPPIRSPRGRRVQTGSGLSRLGA
jgi:hypothetical protein